MEVRGEGGEAPQPKRCGMREDGRASRPVLTAGFCRLISVTGMNNVSGVTQGRGGVGIARSWWPGRGRRDSPGLQGPARSRWPRPGVSR